MSGKKFGKGRKSSMPERLIEIGLDRIGNNINILRRDFFLVVDCNE